MSYDEMNTLRPGESVVYEVGNTKTRGRVVSVWRDSHFSVKWDGEKSIDTIMITKDGDKHISKFFK